MSLATSNSLTAVWRYLKYLKVEFENYRCPVSKRDVLLFPEINGFLRRTRNGSWRQRPRCGGQWHPCQAVIPPHDPFVNLRIQLIRQRPAGELHGPTEKKLLLWNCCRLWPDLRSICGFFVLSRKSERTPGNHLKSLLFFHPHDLELRGGNPRKW